MKFNPFEHEDYIPRTRCSIAAAIIGAGALGAGANIYGATTAANAQKDSQGKNIDFQNQLFNILRGQAQPFIDAGKSALPTLQSLITPGPNQTSTLNNIPGFQFAQDWGQKAVQNLGTTRGLGGNTLKAGADYATGVAQQGWGSIANALQALVNTGSSAVGTLTGAGNSFGGQVSNALTGIGNAGAGAATSIGNSVGNFGSSVSSAAILQKLTGGGGGGIYDTGQYPAGAGNAPSYPNPYAEGGSWFL